MTYDPGKDPAFPLPIGQPGPIGLTKREYFAGLILAGMYANSSSRFEQVPMGGLAFMAADQADHLLGHFAYLESDDSEDVAMEELRSEYAPVEQTLLGEIGHE